MTLRIKRVYSEELREKVYALRYQAYRREHAIAESANERFEDQYDLQPNHVLWALTDKEKVIGSIRATWYEVTKPYGIPETACYMDDIIKIAPKNFIFMSANRLVTEKSNSKHAMLLIRHCFATVENMHSSTNLPIFIAFAVRQNHLSFYKRIFPIEYTSDARIYSGLACSMFLNIFSFEKIETVYQNNSILRMKGYERLFFDENYRDVWEIGLPVEV